MPDVLSQQEMLHINKEGWDVVAPQFFEGTKDTLSYGPYAPTEEELGLLGPVAGNAVVEIGCGSGHTLEYLARKGARELWGVDMSTRQIETARATVKDVRVPVYLVQSPMEEVNLPASYFDLAVSIYAIGWTVDLANTFHRIHHCLKPGAPLVFSWEHPMHSSVAADGEQFVLNQPYVEDRTIRWESFRGEPVIAHHRKLSTFLNAMIATGFVIDQMVEESRIPEDDARPASRWYSGARAKWLPSTFIVKGHKR